MIHQFKFRAGQFLSYLFMPIIAVVFLASCKGPKAATTSTDTLPNALLWKIEGKALPETSYLFGTIHMIPEEDYFLPSGLEDAFKQSDRVVFEIDLDEMSDMGSMMGMLSNLMMDNGMTLNKIMTPEEYKEVSAYFEGMGLPMFLLNGVKPMFLSMLAEMSMDPSSMESEEIISYEMELYDMANSSSKTVGGLETIAYQM